MDCAQLARNATCDRDGATNATRFIWIRAIYTRKIRRVLNKTRIVHLYEHVLSRTRTAPVNGSRLISVLDSFSCVLPVETATNKVRKFSCQKLTHAYHAFASYVRREGHLYEVFLVLSKNKC